MASETELIERVRRRFPTAGRGLRVGIGDDAAVLRPNPNKDWVITTDSFLENVHFLRKVHPPEAAGYKALARATSDIAAMGARGRFFFVTVGLPEGLAGRWLDAFLKGMSRAARRFGLALAGGDTTNYPSLVASFTVLGECGRGQAILRSGARPGDLLCVSGRLGEAELGWRLIGGSSSGKKLTRGANHLYKRLLNKHLRPEPRLEVGQWLASRRLATAMIDTSDGLSTDLGHICKASGVGAVVWAAKIPVVRVPAGLQKAGFDAIDLALNGGEDYELLFTISRKNASRLPSPIGGVPLTVIGEITRPTKIRVVDSNGKSRPLRPGGWEPFRDGKGRRGKSA
jgi:thiamine-monophosphate kinase